MSSAGLRILLTTQQAMEDTNRPDVTVKGANKDIKGVFAVTGFDNVLNVE
jgi:anti-anti-sigma regulatory factor